MPDSLRTKCWRLCVAPVVIGCSIAVTLGACASTSGPTTAAGHHVDEVAIDHELAREFPRLQTSPAFRVQVSNIADLCRSTTEDFRINARSIATPDLQRRFRRQIAAGCGWRLGELDHLFAAQGTSGKD